MTQQEIEELAREFGIDALAAVPSRPVPADRKTLLDLYAGYPPEFAYLARGLEKRLDPGQILAGDRSVWVGLVGYGGLPARPDPLPEGTAWISRFAWCRDYHETVGARFESLAAALRERHGAAARSYVDTGSILEKSWACRGGLGFIGRNGLLISSALGSFCFIGTIITDIEVPEPQPVAGNGCGSCSACVSACPTGALPGDGRVDVSRCLAHITVTSKEPPPPDINLAGNLFGCDICQDACPHNSPRRPTPVEFLPREGLFCPDLHAVRGACRNRDRFKALFGQTPVFRRKPERLQETVDRLMADPADS